MFDWDRSNLRKIRAHRISREDAQRLLALVVTERGSKIRVVTAYDLDAGQKRDYFTRRMQGE
jgi:hypothetical protein